MTRRSFVGGVCATLVGFFAHKTKASPGLSDEEMARTIFERGGQIWRNGRLVGTHVGCEWMKGIASREHNRITFPWGDYKRSEEVRGPILISHYFKATMYYDLRGCRECATTGRNMNWYRRIDGRWYCMYQTKTEWRMV